MMMRVLSVGLLAGLLAGVVVATLQNFTTTPLILAAEVFENAEPEKKASLRDDLIVHTVASDMPHFILVHGDSGHEHGAAEEWGPQDGAERIFYTSTATIGTAIGFAFLLLAGMLLAGDTINERTAIAWAAAGFVVTGLAPAAGLSPELPGMPAADLLARQAWWVLTAASTAAALWLFLRTDNISLKLVAILLLIAPHILGAPHLHEAEVSRVPAELAARFAAMSLAVHAALWIATGVAVALFWPALARVGAPAAESRA
jgi:cobalt transporter subunit CbtA